MAHRIDIRPMSVNEAWQGRRFKTKGYQAFEKACLYMLPMIEICQPPFEVKYKFGFSNVAADLGNPEKLITDILCKKYGFNDNDIYRIVLEKEIVRKGREYFEFEITHFKGRILKQHTRIYMDAFGFDESDFIPCEVCGKKAVDIHHIEARGMGGTKEGDTIENLMALCRGDHVKYGDKKEFKQFLKEIHLNSLKHT